MPTNLTHSKVSTFVAFAYVEALVRASELLSDSSSNPLPTGFQRLGHAQGARRPYTLVLTFHPPMYRIRASCNLLHSVW